MNFQETLNQLNPTKNKFRIENELIGEKYNKTQERAEQLFTEITEYNTIPANKHGPSCLDGFLEWNGEFKAGYEIKSRNVHLYEVAKWGSLLISKHKIENCVSVCYHLCVPFIVILYSIPDDKIKYWFVSDDQGNLVNTLKLRQKIIKGRNEDVYLLPYKESF